MPVGAAATRTAAHAICASRGGAAHWRAAVPRARSLMLGAPPPAAGWLAGRLAAIPVNQTGD